MLLGEPSRLSHGGEIFFVPSWLPSGCAPVASGWHFFTRIETPSPVLCLCGDALSGLCVSITPPLVADPGLTEPQATLDDVEDRGERPAALGSGIGDADALLAFPPRRAVAR